VNRKEQRAEYKRMKQEDHPVQTCFICGQKGAKKSMEPHHPLGRHGENILYYKWVHGSCHRGAHDKPKLATQRGWLEAGRNT
jgi:hypothetical protein